MFNFSLNDTESVDELPLKQQGNDHDAWFRKKVEEGLIEANDPNTSWASNEEVFRKIDERLESFHERMTLKKAS